VVGQASFPVVRSGHKQVIAGVRVMIMGQELHNIERMYDTVAKEYAEAFYGEHEKKPKDQDILRRFSREIGEKKPVWDFGCGPGQTTQYLKDLGIEISGLDLSEKILEQARTLHPAIPFRKGNILELEFDDDSIAGVVAFYTIVHFTERQVGVAFREVFRVLQPGGLFLFTYHMGEETIHVEEFLGKQVDIELRLFKTEFMCRCLEKTGFTIIDVIFREPYPGVEYETRRAYVFAKKPVGQETP
jgi:ubiquinone/menaquinone biosynthesis C-methylase UbiE